MEMTEQIEQNDNHNGIIPILQVKKMRHRAIK